MAEVRRLIESGAIGKVVSVRASFCQNDGAGSCSAMAETGIYCAQLLLWTCEYSMPEPVMPQPSYRTSCLLALTTCASSGALPGADGGVAPRVAGVTYSLDDETGHDTHVAAVLEWPCGGVGSFECSLRHPSPRSATICGTLGVIELPFPFWCPAEVTVQTMTGLGSQTFGEKKTIRFPLPEVSGAERLNFVHSEGLLYEAAEATRCLQQGYTESPLFGSDECLAVMRLISEIRSRWSA